MVVKRCFEFGEAARRAYARVEFIDENGDGAGIGPRKCQRPKQTK
jgi:hypothetical protein